MMRRAERIRGAAVLVACGCLGLAWAIVGQHGTDAAWRALGNGLAVIFFALLVAILIGLAARSRS